jgi:hypothetical protein
MIVQRVAISKIAQKYDLPYHSVYMHSRLHIARQLLTSSKMRQMLNLDAVSHEFQTLYERAKELFNRIEGEAPSHVTASLLRELRSTLETLAKWGISLETLTQSNAQQTATGSGSIVRESLSKLSSEELHLFQYLMAKMNGEEPEPPAMLPARSRRELPRPVIDITPVCAEPEAELPTLDLEPAQEPEPEPYKPTRRPRFEPSPHEVERGRREITERILDSF